MIDIHVDALGASMIGSGLLISYFTGYLHAVKRIQRRLARGEMAVK